MKSRKYIVARLLAILILLTLALVWTNEHRATEKSLGAENQSTLTTCVENHPQIVPSAWPSESNLTSKIKARVLEVPKTVQHYASGDVLADDGNFSLRVLVRPKRVCDLAKNSADQISIAFFMKTRPDEVLLREAIRATWAFGLKDIRKLWSAVYFVVGVTDDHAVNSKVMVEARENDDLFVVNFRDTYRNLTLKTYSMLLLASRFCRDVQFIMNGDTDTLFLPGNIYGLLIQLSTEKWNKSIIGACWTGANVIRDPKDKFYVPKEAWPYEHFPLYCSGYATLLTNDVPGLLLENVPSMRFVQDNYLEDVLFTGVLAMLAGVELIRLPGVSPGPVAKIKPCDNNMFAIHGMKSQILAKQYYYQWNNQRIKCGYCA